MYNKGEKMVQKIIRKQKYKIGQQKTLYLMQQNLKYASG